MIEPIDAVQRAEVLARTHHYIERAGELLEYSFAVVPVEFDLRGTTAGMFKSYGKKHWIRYNPWIFAKYYEENLRDTVPHEVAHYIIHHLYDTKRVKPHGPEWQALMAAFGADPGVTFNLDLSGIPQRRQRSHPYRCHCQDHAVSSTRHNRVQKGKASYQCRSCHGDLVYVG
ncbi:MAG: SprT-like domain-containing protein [Halieaceae bacterium]